MVRSPGFEPGSSAWQADVLTKLDYDRPRQSTFINILKVIPTKMKQNIINTLITLKGNGKSDNTIKTISYKLRQIAQNCNLDNPDEVKQYIANATHHRTKKPLDNATKERRRDNLEPYGKKPRKQLTELRLCELSTEPQFLVSTFFVHPSETSPTTRLPH
jgi:hypothetical protein